MSIAMAEETVTQVAEQITDGRLKLGIGDNLLDAVLGYLVVFIGLTLLMIVVILVGRMFVAKKENATASGPVTEKAPAEPAVSSVPRALAPGSAGEVRLYDTDPRDAALIMAIVANQLGKPLNELRFRSIKEVK